MRSIYLNKIYKIHFNKTWGLNNFNIIYVIMCLFIQFYFFKNIKNKIFENYRK